MFSEENGKTDPPVITLHSIHTAFDPTASFPRSQSAQKGGCWTCRVRRKKCDEQREGDSCLTCKRLTLQCLGWGPRRPEWMRDKRAIDNYRADIKAQLERKGLIRGQSRTTHPNHSAHPTAPFENPYPRLTLPAITHDTSSSSTSQPFTLMFPWPMPNISGISSFDQLSSHGGSSSSMGYLDPTTPGHHFNAQKPSPSDIFLPTLNYSDTSLGTTGLVAGGPTPLPPTSNIPSNLLGKYIETEAAKMPIGIQIASSAINNPEDYNDDVGIDNDTKDGNESDDETVEDNTNQEEHALLQRELDPQCQQFKQVDTGGPLLNGIGSSGIDLFSGTCNTLKTIFSTSSKYKKLLRLEQSAAQLVLDVIQIILDYAVINLMDSKFQNVLLKTMLRLSKRSALCPRSYMLSGIERDEYPIASGHFGEIYRGNYNGRKVSLKVFKLYASQMSKIKDLLKAFYKEAILWRHLVHANLLPFYGIYQLGDSGGRICLVSPWMDNGNITQYLQRHPDTNRQHLVLDIAQGIAYLHGRSIVHGDLKGVNVLLSDNGVACLADFGLSSIINTHTLTWTSVETTVSNAGTVRWQAPELIGMEDTPDVGVTKESDMYAFACVCYEIFIGNVPFYQLTYEAAVIRKVMLGQRPLRPEPNSPPYTTWGLSDWMWSLIEECWCEGPTDRPKSSEVVERLSSREEFRRDEVNNLDSWGDLRPEVFRSLLDQRSPVSNADILLSVSLLNSL